VSGQTVCTGGFTSREKLELEAGWALRLVWMLSGSFGEEIVLLLLPRFEPQIFQHIS
jgi:hypothetical protein